MARRGLHALFKSLGRATGSPGYWAFLKISRHFSSIPRFNGSFLGVAMLGLEWILMPSQIYSILFLKLLLLWTCSVGPNSNSIHDSCSLIVLVFVGVSKSSFRHRKGKAGMGWIFLQPPKYSPGQTWVKNLKFSWKCEFIWMIYNCCLLLLHVWSSH